MNPDPDPSHDPDRDRDRDDATVDELSEIVLERLGPALLTYRREVARCAGLAPDELSCLDQLRRCGRAPAATVGGWLGVTRSALSKSLRRLEEAGHLERRLPARRGQRVEVAWCPSASRDAVLDQLRERLYRDLAQLAVTYRLDDPDRYALVAWWTVQVADLFTRHARALQDAAERSQLLERRRRERAATPDPWSLR